MREYSFDELFVRTNRGTYVERPEPVRVSRTAYKLSNFRPRCVKPSLLFGGNWDSGAFINPIRNEYTFWDVNYWYKLLVPPL